MITITTNHDWATSVDDLRQGLINTINTEQEEYQEDGGWYTYSDEEINEMINEFEDLEHNGYTLH